MGTRGIENNFSWPCGSQFGLKIRWGQGTTGSCTKPSAGSRPWDKVGPGLQKNFFSPSGLILVRNWMWSYWQSGHSSSVVYYQTMKDLPLNVATGTWVTRVYNLWIESSSSFLLRARRILTLNGTFLENQNKNTTLREMSLAKTIPV